MLLLFKPTAFLALSRSDSSDLSEPETLSPSFCESDLLESGWTVAAALSRLSLAFSPRPFCESGLRAEEACDRESEQSSKGSEVMQSVSKCRKDRKRQEWRANVPCR